MLEAKGYAIHMIPSSGTLMLHIFSHAEILMTFKHFSPQLAQKFTCMMTRICWCARNHFELLSLPFIIFPPRTSLKAGRWDSHLQEGLFVRIVRT